MGKDYLERAMLNDGIIIDKKSQGSDSVLSDLLFAGILTRMQKKKLEYLIEKNGKPSAATMHVGMPDGNIANIDPFGRVTWTGTDNQRY